MTKTNWTDFLTLGRVAIIVGIIFFVEKGHYGWAKAFFILIVGIYFMTFLMLLLVGAGYKYLMKNLKEVSERIDKYRKETKKLKDEDDDFAGYY